MAALLIAGVCFTLSLGAQTVGTPTGSISGKIENAGRCRGVSALDRSLRDPRKVKVFKGKLDGESGSFVIPNLPPGRYDLRIHVEGGFVDGADLGLEEVHQFDEPLTEKDREKILECIGNLPERFCDVVRVLAVDGNGRYAKALVEKVRYRPFHSGVKDARVWRVEVWLMQNAYGKWIKARHGWIVLGRIRAPMQIPLEQLHGLVWLFEPGLGGIEVRAGEGTVVLGYKIPDKWSREKGLVPGSLRDSPLDREQTPGARTSGQ